MGKQKMGFKKWIENFWYHYKAQTIVCAVFIFGAAVCITQCAAKIEPDYYVVLYSDTAFDSMTTEILSQKMELYAEDINDDGETKVQIIDCTFPKGADPNYRMSQVQKERIQLGAGEATIWLMDDYGIEDHSEVFDIFEETDIFDLYGKKAGLFNKTKAFSSINEEYGIGIDKNYYFLLRSPEESQDKREKFEQSKALISKILEEK